MEQTLANPPPLTDDNIRDALHQMDQAITTKEQESTTQDQGMTTQANREVVPHLHEQVTTMASHLRDFTRMRHPILYGSKVDEDPQEFIDEVSKLHFLMEFSTNEKSKLATYKLNDVAQAWYVQWRDNRPLRGGPVTWDIFKADFLYRLLPR